MNKCKFLLLGVIVLFNAQTVQLFAAEGDLQSLDIVDSFVHNQYLLENIKLLELADKCYAEGQFDEAYKYAEEAIQYAQLSDEYINQQMKIIKEANDAITAAQERLNWAENMGAPKNFAGIYEQAKNVYAKALEARSKEDWGNAEKLARQVIAILADIPDKPLFPAQYVVKEWATTKDCLWNIAGKPEIYDDPFQWPVLYRANRSILPKPDDPDLIEPGMILDIPSLKGETRSGVME